MPKRSATKLPSLKEIDAMAVFSSNDNECTLLCHNLLNIIEELAGATGLRKIRLLVTFRAIRRRMLELKCRLCLPE